MISFFFTIIFVVNNVVSGSVIKTEACDQLNSIIMTGKASYSELISLAPDVPIVKSIMISMIPETKLPEDQLDGLKNVYYSNCNFM